MPLNLYSYLHYFFKNDALIQIYSQMRQNVFQRRATDVSSGIIMKGELADDHKFVQYSKREKQLNEMQEKSVRAFSHRHKQSLSKSWTE